MNHAEVRALKRECAPVRSWVRGLVTLGAAAALYWNGADAFDTFQRQEWLWFIWNAACTLVWIGALVAMLRLGYLSDPSMFVTAMFRRRRCPACAYDLSGIPEDDDHITICPECAAAWKLDAPPPVARSRSLKDAFESRRRES